MANADIAFGFEATGVMYGLEPWSVDSSNGTALFRNDLVMLESDGNVAPATAGNTSLIGSIVGTTAATTAQKALLAASTAGTILCHTNLNQMYIAQDDGDATTPAQTHIGNNADHIANAGDTNTGISGHEIDISSVGTSAAGIRLLDFLINSEVSVGVNADWLCLINEHFMRATAGV